jgi:CubicO group peptidase (beta-lactamase class C family)
MCGDDMRSVVISKRLSLAPLLAALSICVAATGTALFAAEPSQLGFSAERLERIGAHMREAVDGGVMVGAQGMIARNGQVVFEETWGMSDREATRPMASDTIFRIYSMSKPITAVALMMLYEEGRFFLNDPVAAYLPELANLEVAVSTADGDSGVASDGTSSTGVGSGDDSLAGQRRKPARQPTIRDLLRHTAGFTYGIFGDTEVDRLYREAGILDRETIADMVAALGQLPLQFEPGTRWHYSVAVDVQGRLVEVLSGMRFGEFLQRRLFGPLGMVDTDFTIPASKRERFARLYSPEGTEAGLNTRWRTVAAANLVPADPAFDDIYDESSTFEPGGHGLVSTAADYLRFCQMMLNGGVLDGVRILSPKTVELMTTNHLGDLPMGFGQSGMGFGLGFAVALDQGAIGEVGSPGEYNWGGAAGTSFWIDPVENLVGVFMVQSIPHQTRLRREYKHLVYQALVD